MRRIVRILREVLSLTLLIAAAQDKGLKFRHQRMTKGYQSGYSFVEAMLVAVLVGIIGGIVVPNIKESMSLYRLTASANLVATELNAGRTLAISRSWLYEVDANDTNHTIQIVDPGDANNNPRTLKSLEPGITFSSVPNTNFEITFYAGGYARSGTLELENEDGDTISVLVGASGRIEIED